MKMGEAEKEYEMVYYRRSQDMTVDGLYFIVLFELNLLKGLI